MKVLAHLTLALAATFAFSTANAGAVAGATEPTQILNNVQLVASYAELAQQTVTEINQYQTMLRNLINSTPSELLAKAAGSLWADSNMTQTFKNLQTIVVAGQKVTYTLQNADQMFRNLHPGYGSAFDFRNTYKNLSANAMNTVQSALALMGAQSQNFSTEAEVVSELSRRSQSAVGQLQALQAGNDIGVAMVNQMQSLRQLQMAQIRQQSDYLAAQQTRADIGDSAVQNEFGTLRSGRVKNLNVP
ncbi:P-type conjugative transfer protein TrbJ [Paracidovorax citrulli]